MMKTKLLGVAAACVLALTVGATTTNATTYAMQFSAFNFVDFNGVGGAPADQVSGNLIYTADSPLGVITSFSSVSLNIAGHNYTTAEVGYMTVSPTRGLIGGVLNGVNQINGGTTDFMLSYRSDPMSAVSLYYSVGAGPFWSTTEFSTFIVGEREPLFTAPIATPLPAALPLFATGLGALGLLGWRRKRKLAASG